MFKNPDRGILYSTLFLVFLGFLIFFSASLTYLKNGADIFFPIILKQGIAIFLGLVLMFWLAKTKFVNSKKIRYWSGYIFVFFAFIQLLVLTPLGLSIKGGQRWIDFGFITIQPSEFFKYSLIIFLTAIVVTMKNKMKKFKTFFLIVVFLSFISLFFIKIKDIGTLLNILLASFIVFLMSETKFKYIFFSIFLGLPLLFFILYQTQPYIQKRVDVYLQPEKSNILNEAYQINQSEITIGSGQVFGRGFGASMQKFSNSIPEHLNDGIFAVYSEEFGFVGSVLLIFSFLILFFFIILAAQKEKNKFKKIVITALGFMIIFPAFYNIGAILAILPMSGMPLTFVSKGGTAILTSLIAVGIILNFIRNKK